MKSRLKNVLIQTAGILVAATLTYLAMRNVDFPAMWGALRQANYWWLIPLVAVTLVSHFLRAWRWRMFLDALSEDQSLGNAPRVSLWLSFSSVMIGYMINNAAPRLGEFARAANLSSQAKWRFSSVFGTVVVERVLDMVVLLVILIVVGVIIAGSAAAETVLFGPLRTRFAAVSVSDVLIACLVLAALAAMVFLLPSMLRKHRGASRLIVRLGPVIASFREGFLTLFRSKNRAGIFVTTVLIWTGYWLMLYLPLFMLHMRQPYGVGAETAFVLLGIGSLGFVVPAPGGIGAYHYFVIQTFVHLYAVPYDVAAGFAVLTHAAQLVLLSTGGFVCLLAQGSSVSSMIGAARKARSKTGEEHAPTSESEGYISS
ncbi:MAG: lysylphosphatidylglycerol synthase transmembrane domain-containing protein [Rhodothermales bacterium]